MFGYALELEFGSRLGSGLALALGLEFWVWRLGLGVRARVCMAFEYVTPYHFTFFNLLASRFAVASVLQC